jgi:hypothetical protein
VKRAPSTNLDPLVPKFDTVKGTNALNNGVSQTQNTLAFPSKTVQTKDVVTSTNDTGAGGFGATPASTSAATQTSKIWNVSIPAAQTVNGQFVPGALPIAATGTQFFVTLASASINIRVPNGVFNSYSSNQKVVFQKAFAGLELQNLNAFAVAVSIFVGWDDFTSYQFTLQNSAVPNVTYATSGTPNTVACINIPDLMGQAFTAADGSAWIAVQRVAVIVSNEDASQVLRLQGGLNLTTSAGGVVTIQPKTDIAHPSSGNFCLTINNSTNVNATVSEIYLALPA